MGICQRRAYKCCTVENLEMFKLRIVWFRNLPTVDNCYTFGSINQLACPVNCAVSAARNDYIFMLQKVVIIQSIKHPYISPLTLIKLNKYKMIDEKDKFKENKERYDNNIIKSYKKRGLNQFGYPISYDKTLSRKYTYNNIKLKK